MAPADAKARQTVERARSYTTHRSEIGQFLTDRQFLFFPEVVLSASLNFDSAKVRGKSVPQPGEMPITDYWRIWR